ncbi:protein LURP-one-related 8 [Brassica rapa]|nr:protein LURP-one-related 8 [Brassica rapa]
MRPFFSFAQPYSLSTFVYINTQPPSSNKISTHLLQQESSNTQRKDKHRESRRKMTKVHPKFPNTYEESLCDSKAAVVLTVWRKSLLFNCDGFTVYNSNGNLVFRVDNYMNSPKDNIVLMDASGLPLLSIRRKKLSMGDCWAVYDGETQRDPIFTAKKNVSILTNKRSLAWVSVKKTILYEVEGSYGQRSCKIVDVRRNKKKTAEIKRKDAMVGGGSFGKDVFKLIVEPEMEPRVAMALTIILDKMFRSY